MRRLADSAARLVAIAILIACASFACGEPLVQLSFPATDAAGALDRLFRGSSDKFTIAPDAAKLPVPATDLSGISRESALKMIGKTAGFTFTKTNGAYVVSKAANAKPASANLEAEIAAPKVEFGMTRAQVREAVGKPRVIRYSTIVGIEEWVYGDQSIVFAMARVSLVKPAVAPASVHTVSTPRPVLSPATLASYDWPVRSQLGYSTKAPFYTGFMTPDQVWEQNWSGGRALVGVSGYTRADGAYVSSYLRHRPSK